MGKHYKLTYFQGRGQGEKIRYILAYSGKEWEDERLSHESGWPELKPKTPLGKAPVLQVEGKPMLAESYAICRYLANEFGIAGHDHFEQAQVDMLIDGMRDLQPKQMPVMQAKRKMKKEPETEGAYNEILKTFQTESLTPFLERYEGILAKNGGNHFVGSKLTWGDIVIAEFLERMHMNIGPNVLDKYPKLTHLVKTVTEQPHIKAYIDKRPITEN